MENYVACALQFACCGLRHTLPQAAACKLQRAGRMVSYVCVRVIAVMFINTQHASEIAENSLALLLEIQRKLKYVQLGAACGLRPAAKYEPIKPTHSFYFSCGLRQSMNWP